MQAAVVAPPAAKTRYVEVDTVADDKDDEAHAMAASALSRELGELHIATKVCSPIGQGGESPN